MRFFKVILIGIILIGLVVGCGGGDSDTILNSTAPGSTASGNTTPAISGTPMSSVVVAGAYSFTPTASDADGDALLFYIENMPSWASFDASTGTLTGTPQNGDRGSYSDIIISASDGESVVSLSPFSVDVVSGSSVQTFLVLKTAVVNSYINYDDGYYQTGLPRSYTRDNVNDIVTDNTTGLEWQDDAAAATTQGNESASVAYCDGLTLGGHNDWRLPTLKELTTIIDYSISNPPTNAKFHNVAASGYWSSTRDAYLTSFAWGIDFNTNGENFLTDAADSHYSRCVR